MVVYKIVFPKFTRAWRQEIHRASPATSRSDMPLSPLVCVFASNACAPSPTCSFLRCLRGSLRGWRNTVGNLIEISWLQKGLPPASFYRYMRETYRGKVSSNSRCQKVLFQQHSANLSFIGSTLPGAASSPSRDLHPVRIARIRCPRFVPRVGSPRNLFLIGSLTAALRFSKGWVRKTRILDCELGVVLFLIR